jgi:hypothetical protein
MNRVKYFLMQGEEGEGYRREQVGIEGGRLCGRKSSTTRYPIPDYADIDVDYRGTGMFLFVP